MSELVRTLSRILKCTTDPVGTGAQHPPVVHPAIVGSDQKLTSAVPEAEILTDDDQTEIQREKIAAVRRAIDSGDYDSDELLQIAMERMLRRLRDAEETP